VEEMPDSGVKLDFDDLLEELDAFEDDVSDLESKIASLKEMVTETPQVGEAEAE
jgi:prefoldin subunit 5